MPTRSGRLREPRLVKRASPQAQHVRLEPEWAGWDDERLLELRFSSLSRLNVRDNGLDECISRLRGELSARNLKLPLHFWLSSEFFCPDGVPGVAIPFYLAHPRLVALEQSQMLEVEGGTPEWCMRILRHEAGHAIENTFRLKRRRRRIALFGRSSQRYPTHYTPRPYSRSYVVHLEAWYAQSHPDEDFAETFAVWLTSDGWRQRYVGWPVLKKLEYVDELMQSLVGERPLVHSRRQVDPLRSMDKTLREHYADKRKLYGLDYPVFYDRELRRMFSSAPEYADNPAAARFLASVRHEVRRVVRRWTGVYQYTIDRVLEDMIERCKELNLRLALPPDRAKLEFTALLTYQTMNFLQSGRHRIAL